MLARLENSRIYIEHEHKKNDENKNVAKYSVHISFTSDEEALAFYSIMENHLPLSLKENRIIIATEGSLGVHTNVSFKSSFFPFVYLNFNDSAVATEFALFLKRVYKNFDQTKFPEAYYHGDHVRFLNLLQPNFSIEHRKRINNEALNRSFIVFLLLKDLKACLPNELTLLIGLNVYHSILNRTFEINKHFKLPLEQFKQPYKKIDCEITYSAFNYDSWGAPLLYDVHLICSNAKEAAKLKKYVDKALTRIDFTLENNELIIHPSFLKKDKRKNSYTGCIYSSDKSKDKINIGIQFGSPAEAATFDSFVNITSFKASLNKQQLCFEPCTSLNLSERKKSANLPGKNSLFFKNEQGKKPNVQKSFTDKIFSLLDESASPWEMSACEMIAWGCFPIVGWAYLLYYAIHHYCCSIEKEADYDYGFILP
ncbi:MAG: hypothetical protein H0U73_05470 [Tatlockia sp.]|nr:hypothetical protein [Tatlockia sp.]